MNVRLPTIIALSVLAVACGSDDRERGPNRLDPGNDASTTDDPDAGGGTTDDMGGTGDPDMTDPQGGDGGDGDTDVGVEGDAGGRDVPTGMTCGYTDITPFPSSCDFVTLAGCPDPNEACLVTVTIAGPDTTLSAICRDSSNNFLEEDEPCADGGGECAPGLICVSFYGTCRRLCEAETGLGCESADSCRRPTVEWGAVGFCDIRCPM